MIFKYDKYGFIPIDLICLNHGSSKIILSNLNYRKSQLLAYFRVFRSFNFIIYDK